MLFAAAVYSYSSHFNLSNFGEAHNFLQLSHLRSIHVVKNSRYCVPVKRMAHIIRTCANNDKIEGRCHDEFVFFCTAGTQVAGGGQDSNGNAYVNGAAEFGDEKLQDDSV